jgi:zinc and cadmium transporter
MLQSNAAILALAVVLAGVVAGVIPLFFQWSHRTAHRWIAFGAGVIIGAAVLHLLPEAYELAGAGGIPFVLLGFLLLYGIEQSSIGHRHGQDDERGEFQGIGALAVIGLTLHNLVDGIVLGSGEHSPTLGLTIFLAVLLHKIPTIFSLSVLLVHGEFSRPRILLLLGVVLAAIPIGTAAAYFWLGEYDSAANLGRLIFFSAGTFLYIGAYELLPEMHRRSASDRWIGAWFASGVLLMFISRLWDGGM